MPIAKLITRLCLLASILRAALVGVAVWVGRGMADGGKIVFQSWESVIYLADVDSGTLHNLTLHQKVDGFPVLSPDGQRMAFISSRAGVDEVYVTELFTGVKQRLVNIIGFAVTGTVTWSPDGSRLAYDGNGEIWVVEVNSGEIRNLTKHPSGDRYPVWSPDGSYILFQSERDTGYWQIYRMDSNGNNLKRLTYSNYSCELPVWSPDGSQIAFELSANIYTMDAHGSNLQRLTYTNYPEASSWGASWSPDGNEIMFITQYGNPPAGFERDIYTIDLNTRVVRRLTQHPASDDNPIWLSDGLTIAFRSDRDYASSAVYLMNSDGENVRHIVYDAPTFTWWP